MADNLKFCHICYQKHVSKPSTVWCSECEQVFCTDCAACHLSIQSTKEHKTTPIETYLALGEYIWQISTLCSSHAEKYEMFCKTHDIPLCNTCVEEHSDCKGLSPLNKLLKNVKLSQTANDIDESLRDVEQNVSKIKTYLEKNQHTLNQTKNEILSEINKTRKTINAHLDKLEKRLTEEVTDLQRKARNQLDSLLKSLHEKAAKTQSHRNQVDMVKKHGSDLQTFLVFGQISLHIDSSEKDFTNLMKNGSFDQLLLECDINDRLTHLNRDIETFGEVRLQKLLCDITLDNHKENQAQAIVSKSTSLDKLKISKVMSFDTVSNSIYGCDITPDGTMISTDFNGKCLIGTDSTGKHLFSISVAPNIAFDVTVIDDKTVAVTSGPYEVIIVDISSLTVKRTISVGYDCWGVTHRDGSLFVCAENHGILSINLTNDKTTPIIQCDLPYYSYITSYKDKLYYTDYKSETVTCCDLRGNTIWTFKEYSVMRSPLGITTDNTGRVYVCDDIKDSVIVLSDDGKESKTLISKNDGLERSYALHYDNTMNNLLVGNEEKTVFLFHVSG